MPSSLTLKTLLDAVSGTACAFRSRTRLQPADGPGGKIFPPTHLGGEYAIEQRRRSGADGTPEEVTCVLVDSVQSSANRLEDALKRQVDSGRLVLPIVRVDFDNAQLTDPIGSLSTLDVPHRLADAILRDSLIDENGKAVPFRKSSWGSRLDVASLANATPLLEISPTSLLFGLWDSTGPKGGLGAKFQRAIVSEIVAIGAAVGVRTSSRIDPLQIRSGIPIKKGDDSEYDVAPKETKGTVQASEINHGNIPPTIDVGGITCDYCEHSLTLSLPALRRLRFPIDGQWSHEADTAGRTLIASIGLMASALAYEAGFDLRSRCLLWPETPFELELLDRPGETPQRFALTGDQGIALYNEAVEHLRGAGLPYHTEPVTLRPKESLMKLLIASQEKAASESSTEGD
ncbi:type I-G CRISPR-associated RAMP protein Csb1/Cas7g [Roseiconus lacunae]|uniref:type I-G CRISPR-associated RAMP protein Csb1/Cas7g n=1 Tax=Roseiconus lacunae TaxID=2605694 RepID=UPI001E3DDCBF|nr:type I-U CRISPR-associated RAMP protein Csb1/Cas7u [Roseiconus lacunae]MCD0462126.1 type I-U CRISPR-associated RAMP protein Csb1/Cas7u [Roseiconus lacunae]